MKQINIFVSYSHKNSNWLNEKDEFSIIPFLEKSLEYQKIKFWYDHDLRTLPGIEYEKKINEEIDHAQVAILLLSQDFINSKFIREKELPRIKENLNNNKISIIPILVEPWTVPLNHPAYWLTKTQIIPGEPTPLVNFTESKSQFLNERKRILQSVTRIIESLNTSVLELPKIQDVTSENENFDSNDKRLKVFLKANSIKKKRLVYTGIVLVAMIIGYFLFTNVIPKTSKTSKISNDSTLTLVSISKIDTIPNEQDTLKAVNTTKPISDKPSDKPNENKIPDTVNTKYNTTNPEVVKKKPINPDNKFVDFTETAENVNIDMVAITGGTFQMGSPESESGRKSNETQHTVTVSDFYMGKYEVTFAQYDVYCEATGKSKPADQGWGRGNRPVIYVSWNDADAYCKWLSQKTGKTYRLPTEAEWEYAARAGTTTPFNTGNCLSTSQANYNGNYPFTGCSKGEYRHKTLPVGSFSPNSWGLYDMHGNVWELCNDWYDAGYYSISPRNNPPGPPPGSGRVLRGGSWYFAEAVCRVSYRSSSSPGFSNSGEGFRLVLAKDYNEQDTPKQGNLEKKITSQPKTVEQKPIITNNKFINFTETAENVNINMVAITGGTFQMGSLESEPERRSDETQHTVTVSDFYMGKYEVTFAQYDAYCEATGKSKPNDSGWGRGNRPVINVSWYDSDAYCKWLSQKTGKTYRLPTEAEWEYAARAGTTTPFNTGNCLSTSQANYNGNYPFTGCSNGEYRKKTLQVGSFSPNSWGLYDMHGNGWEWCNDWYDAGYYANSPRNNPLGPPSSPDSSRVLRSGSWYFAEAVCRVSYRGSASPSRSAGLGSIIIGYGFRLVLSPD